MKAFVVGQDGPSLQKDFPVPTPQPNEALVKVLRAGICNTDLELLKGYKGGMFRGVLGHEFVGEVVECSSKPDLVGSRVAGELNISCSNCRSCARGGDVARNHCLSRRVLGIINHDGTYAEYLTLPVVNLHVVPPSVPVELAAFVEPLAAACRIVEQNLIKPTDKVCVLGDGKLGLLIAEVLIRQNLQEKITLMGRHVEKAALLGESAATFLHAPQTADELPDDVKGNFDVVVDAAGTVEGLKMAAAMTVPMGTIVLKSTCAAKATIDTSGFVVQELTIVGSRCGPFPEAIQLLTEGNFDPSKYITAVYTLDQVEEAMEVAGSRGALKVQLAIAESELPAATGQRR
eukprot:CAMPEP_0206428928 /NCGR_PEP_ID=MMETSP0324_2-20121206/5945_1 /ASSEMBLY_ACC=CAM_ASM_000836 /TAXON_ID=2866 /ORGANISM="Crypthecodinium cohnii, Strain Seligo" /LENGTH=345 /DNA_ID=CAMNT_0053894527 /DNA_START=103 /DNA_END=1140 /DNA_ORIENTATION=+